MFNRNALEKVVAVLKEHGGTYLDGAGGERSLHDDFVAHINAEVSAAAVAGEMFDATNGNGAWDKLVESAKNDEGDQNAVNGYMNEARAALRYVIPRIASIRDPGEPFGVTVTDGLLNP